MRIIRISSVIIFIIVLVILTVHNFIFNFSVKKKNIKLKENIEIEKQKTLFLEAYVLNLFSQNILSSGLILSNIKVLNEKGDKVNLNTLFTNHPKLVLRYSDINCRACVDSCLIYIEKYKNKIGHENILILASYNRQQDLFIFKRINNVSFEIFNIEGRTLGLPLENENSPFIFISNNTLITQDIFLFEKTMPKFIDMYFNSIIHRHFNDNK